MLFKRRASLSSASNLSRRIRHELAANSIQAGIRDCVLRCRILVDIEKAIFLMRSSTISRLYPGSTLSLSRAMHSTSPRSTRAPSPTSDCKWKRGRPVTARSSVFKPAQQAWNAQTSSLPGQLVIMDTPTLIGAGAQIRQVSTTRHVEDLHEKDTEASNDDAVQRIHLWDASKPLRFAPTAVMEGDPSTLTTVGAGSHFSTDARVVRNSDLNQPPGHVQTDRHPVVEDDHSSEGESASQMSTTANHSSDSEYMKDEDHNNVSEQENNIRSLGEDVAEKYVPLAYQIPEDTLRAAMLASPNTRASYWSTKLYRGPQGEALSTHYCKSMEVAERVAQYFLKEKVVGFDIEWKPAGKPASIKENASLIQLACGDRIALFHISLFPGITAEQLMPPSLRAVLESPEVYKVGVAVKGDFTRLEKHLGVHAQGVFELSRLHNLVEWYETDPSKVTNRLVSLATQVLQHLQLPLYKGGQLDDEPDNTSSVRESDWSQPLDLQQIHYAAADAYAGFRLYHVLERKRKRLRPIPPAIGLCDYDSKRALKPKEPRKRTKPASKPNSPGAAGDGRPAEVVEQEQEEVEGEEGYETAPEELMDSHQLEDPVPKSLSETSGQAVNVVGDAVPKLERKADPRTEHEHETTRMPTRVGRVNLTQLRGPDPAYPNLPPDTNETAIRPLDFQFFDHFSTSSTNRPPDNDVSETQSPEHVDAAHDEFADPELDEALKAMVLDGDGQLRDDTVEAASKNKTEREVQGAATTSSNLVEGGLELDKAMPTNASNHSNTEVIELSDLNPVGLEVDELHTATTPMFKPLTILSERSPHTPEYHLATIWAQDYLQSTIPSPTCTAPSRIRATVPHLRAYHLWHQQKLSLDEIGKHLRDPPLSHNTVISYVLQAISLERLEYEKESLRDMMMAMPWGLRNGRWKWLAEKVGALR